MMRCRICRTQQNLKFSSQQLRLELKRSNKKLRLPLSAIPQTSGNICLDCDLRLQNFHQEDDGSDVVDVDSDSFNEKKKKPHVDVGNDDRGGNDGDEDDEEDDEDDRRLLGMYNKPAMPPLSQSCNLGSDGDAEVIEVLTSRETTPDITANFRPDNIESIQSAPIPPSIPAEPIVIDVIDLMDDDDAGEERENDNEREKEEQSPTSNKTAKSPPPAETRLLGCLSLISSDSESEIQFEACPPPVEKSKDLKKSPSPDDIALTKGFIYDGVECTNNNNLNCENSSIILQHSMPVCGICGISFLDNRSLQEHMEEHEEYQCPSCQNRFQMCLDLVYHMRQKHRSYHGNELSEGARCSQDSAMTIRLRFMQRFTFYECQLCGLIESQFKMHKMHIMQKHADESKSLRDPMMKTQLKCPSCHQGCGTQQIEVFRHLLSKHDSVESGKYLREVEDVESLGIKHRFLRTLQEGGRFLTFGTQKQFFIECLFCRKAFSGTKTFSKHLAGHNKNEWKMRDFSDPSKAPLKRKIETRHAGARVEKYPSKRMGEVLFHGEKQPPPPAKKLKLEYQNPPKNGVKSKKPPPSKDSKSKVEESLPSTHSNKETKAAFLAPADSKRQKKLKHKLEKDTKRGGHSKAGASTAPPPPRVKVKPPLRHFPTQKYNCQHCQLTIKGFRKLQLHLLRVHRADEYHSCERCPRAFTTKASLEVHRSQDTCRRRRKWRSSPPDGSDGGDELKNNQKEEEEEEEEPLVTSSSTYWLLEIIQLARERQLRIDEEKSGEAKDNGIFLSPPPHGTLLPAHTILFRTAKEYSDHETTHIAHKDTTPWINLQERKRESASTSSSS